MLFKKIQPITKVDLKINTKDICTINSANLVFVEGKGALATCSYSISDSYYGSRYISQITLNDVPIIQINSPSCPTCNSILATGYGIKNAKCKELNDIQERINAPFVSLDNSIDAITPLLTLLKSGLYVIADAECYPTDGNGNFFWNATNEFVENPATSGVSVQDADYAYISGHPIYLYPTQDTDCYNEDCVNHYVQLFQNIENAPRAIAYCFGEFISFIIDGHHKACATSILKKPLNCIVIIPYSGYSYQSVNNKMIPDTLYFSSIKIPVDLVPKKYLPSIPKTVGSSDNFCISSGTINHREWENIYLESAKTYPLVYEYAEMVAADIPCDVPVSEELIQTCLANLNDENQQKMKAIMFILKRQYDIRLKQVAMSCANILPNCKLKQQAYKTLAEIKNDSEIEQFFINYLVYCEDKFDSLLPIVNSYWE